MAVIRSARQLARRLNPCGVHTGLLLLGLGLLVEMIDGKRAEEIYAQIAEDPDPLGMVLAYYRYAGNEPFGWLDEAIKGLTDHVEAAGVAAEEAVQRAARSLVGVAFAESCEYAGGELLGPVRVELETLALGSEPAMAYLELDTALVQALLDMTRLKAANPNKPLGNMADMWCGSGVRTIAMAIVGEMIGYDVNEAHWHHRDPDPVNIALAAINCRAASLPNCSFEVAPGVFNALGSGAALTPEEWQEIGGYTSESMTARDYVAARAAADQAIITALQTSEQRAVTDIIRQALTEGADLS